MNNLLPKLFFVTLLAGCFGVYGQSTPNPRPMTREEYEKAKTFEVKNLDEDTYIKIDNAYVLDRYEMRKPYFITGDDGLKKRIDLYTLLARSGMQPLATVIFYTNEKNKVYKAVLPNFTTDAKVWEKYFEDIHAIDKVETNFVLKLSYVLSKEFSYQIYKSINHGKDLASESATYGNDICFPGDQIVTLRTGAVKPLASVVAGDRIVSIDPMTKQTSVVTVNKVIEHEAKNYALTRLTLIRETETVSVHGIHITLSARTVKATPNHPMKTESGEKTMGAITTGDRVLCLHETSGTYEPFTVLEKRDVVEGVQKVYNIEGSDETPLVLNGVMVLQK